MNSSTQNLTTDTLVEKESTNGFYLPTILEIFLSIIVTIPVIALLLYMSYQLCKPHLYNFKMAKSSNRTSVDPDTLKNDLFLTSLT